MRLGIDLDGVVYDYVAAFEDYLRDRYPEKYDYDAYPPFRADDWYFFKEWGISTEEFLRLNAEAVDEGILFRRGHSIPGSIPTLRYLSDQGHSIHIITHRTFGTQSGANTFEWLQNHGVPHDTVTFAEDKTFIGVDLLLDDRVKNVDASRAAGIPAVLFSQRWNREAHNRLPFVSGWSDFADYVGEFDFKRSVQDASSEDQDDGAPVWRGGVDLDFNNMSYVIFSDQSPDPIKVVDGSEYSSGEIRSVNSDTGGEKGVKPERHDLIPTGALAALARHYGIGAEKYEDHNWRRGYEWSKSFNALRRHVDDFWGGEDIDSETGSPHMAAVAFHAFALLTFMEEHPELDDRWKGVSDGD